MSDRDISSAVPELRDDDTEQGPGRARLPIGEYAASWYDDAPITDQQIIGLAASVADGELPSYSRHVVRKLLAEMERLRTDRDEAIRLAGIYRIQSDQMRARPDAIGPLTEIQGDVWDLYNKVRGLR